jgi:hypothetical protein
MTEKQLKRWSQEVTEHSSALDLAKDVFTLKDPKDPLSLKHSAEVSERRKSDSAMLKLNFYVNRAEKNLAVADRERLGKAKDELRKLFRRNPAG